MQLVAYGAQDVYLTGNPQITFWKVTYRRHTNFAMESIEQTFNGNVGVGNKVTATISRNGDLVHKMYVQMDVTQTFGSDAANALAVSNIGHMLLDNVEIEIGGQKIDKHYNRWLEIWADLTVTSSKRDGYNEMIQNNVPGNVTEEDANSQSLNKILYVPLQFWFCRNPGLALPLIALQYHEVKVNIQWANATDIEHAAKPSAFTSNRANTVKTEVSKLSASLWVDYIYLDTDERRRFAQVSHEYLIEQLQFTGAESTKTSAHRLNFNHPVKELVWVNVDNTTGALANNAWNHFKKTKDAKLQLNGHDRFALRNGDYFSLVQPYQHHTCVPMVVTENTDGVTSVANAHVHVYSFALKPEDHQPSGTCNFSRIDNATLNVNVDSAGDHDELYIFAVNYNVLRIMAGMGGLAYSN